MKIKGINYSLLASILTLSCAQVNAGAMGDPVLPLGTIYLGVFGGGGSVDNNSIRQGGTAFFSEALGGPLAVDAKGNSNTTSAWVVGGKVGYMWPARLLNLFSPNWTFAPATELEGYYIGGSTITGHEINNNTVRLPEHDFYVTYPMHTSVFLVNGVLNANPSNFTRFHPYVGIGIGTSIITVSNASSIQFAPPEPGVNHYNADTRDTTTAFAAQPKIGVSINLSQNTSMFVEYRFLYLSPSNYTFGSTVYPDHAATSNWDVRIGSQYYNMGTVGLQLDL